jgi:serine O-acetyltransferase
MRQATKTQSVEKIDPVWSRIREEAEEIARKEPALGGFIFSLILNHDTFEEALTHRLAQRLGNADIGADLIVHAFNDAIEAEPEIGHAARADIIATFDRDPACHRYIDPLLYFKGYQAIQTHRMAHRLWAMGRKDFAYYLQSRLSVLTSIDIHPGASIGKGIMVDHGHDIVIGETSVIEDNVSIMQGVTLGGTGKEAGDRHPKIRRGVLLSLGAKILGNIEIGEYSRVGAGSVVLKSIPAGCTAVGVPAKLVNCAGSERPSQEMNQIIDEQDNKI